VIRQEKLGKVYYILLLLTILFLAAIFISARGNRQTGQETLFTVTTEKQTEEETAPRRRKININTASAEELEALSGIGPSLAQAILDYRAEHGDFQTEEDLLAVKGIGEAKLADFRAEITFSDEEATS